VLVPVVVRDSHGRPVAHLTKDDFQLFDKGKRQDIASFSAIERPTDLREHLNDKAASTAKTPQPLSSGKLIDSKQAAHPVSVRRHKHPVRGHRPRSRSSRRSL
jgi:hypothetical protein